MRERISESHSINRVKLSLARAEQYNSKRAAGHQIACKQWLGTWGKVLRGSSR